MMSSSFAFVPRKVAKKVKAQSAPQSKAAHPVQAVNTNSHQDVPTIENIPGPSSRVGLQEKGKGKHKRKDNPSRTVLTDEDYAILISLALSDHAIWSDPDLRRAIEQHPDKFIPLSQLLRYSSITKLAGLGRDVLVEETSVVRGLRLHASDVVEVRMLVSEPSTGWNKGEMKIQGGYELRRKDWKEMPMLTSREYTRDDWERRTIYLENIPIQYRNIVGITRMVLSLLSRSSETRKTTTVQTITLPSHYQDKPGEYPKCKGFALVTLADLHDVDVLMHAWPWNHPASRHNQDQKQTSSQQDDEIVRETAKFGLRTLSKSRWDQLKEEYLVYQRELLSELIAQNDGPSDFREANEATEPQSYDGYSETAHLAPRSSDPMVTTHASPYPLDCLVFVRSVHPETNKTTLRKLFSATFGDTSSNNGLDYIDYNKGMDSCYIRLASPSHAKSLVSHFKSHLVAQEHGLDDLGTVATHPHVITMELVQGKKEELYWEKVPEKVRRQAVQKAVSAQSLTRQQEFEAALDEGDDANSTTMKNGKRRKRKRDK